MKSYLTDTPEELLDGINQLVDLNIPFGIMCCRSGIAIDLWIGNTPEQRSEPTRVAYTVDNFNNLTATIKEAISKTGGELV